MARLRILKVLSLDRSVDAVHYRRRLALAHVGSFQEAEQFLQAAAEFGPAQK